MKKIVVGILAHVDAGKTTLSEALLYECGTIRKMGKVHQKDTFFDNNQMERDRGITIFSKQAILRYEDLQITLIDTPGHVDFSAEMERTLQILDYAILVISGTDGIQAHTQTLWKLLKKRRIPTILFINKMDQVGANKDMLANLCRKRLGSDVIDFTANVEERNEEIATCEERLLEEFFETKSISKESISRAIRTRKIYPCLFGAALQAKGVKELLEFLSTYTREANGEKVVDTQTEAPFGAKVFKITRDASGNRLTFIKVVSGSIKVKSMIGDPAEKINQIRFYSGDKFDSISEASAGDVCALVGLQNSYPGQGLGREEDSHLPFLQPVLNYQILFPDEFDAGIVLPKLRQLEEEEPTLHVIWKEESQKIFVQLMGEVQIEIIKRMIEERFQIPVQFGNADILYKETITNVVEGVGHYEPLRHYAEVHLRLEPQEAGTGIVLESECSEDSLDRNWQHLVLTHIEEREHKGVLMGMPITDVKIVLVSGKAHLKHTEGGDFRQATYRAIRQGLKQAKSIVLEPFYEFLLEVPQKMVGRAMSDIERLHGSFETPILQEDYYILQGTCPVVTMRDYYKEVVAYTKGLGRLTCTPAGYQTCHNEADVLSQNPYDSEADLANPTGSIFCSHGAGFYVKWDEVFEHMHLPCKLQSEEEEEEALIPLNGLEQTNKEPLWIDTEEIDRILSRTSFANQKQSGAVNNAYKKKKVIDSVSSDVRPRREGVRKTDEKYLLVDGYNIIFAWEELKEIANSNLDGARGKLLDIMSNYQGAKQINVMVVFDAYRVKGQQTTVEQYHNITVVYTKEAETADQYIEKFAHENGRKFDVTVATSDGLEQMIITGQGCSLFSARELKEEVKRVNEALIEGFEQGRETSKIRLLDSLDIESKKLMGIDSP